MTICINTTSNVDFERLGKRRKNFVRKNVVLLFLTISAFLMSFENVFAQTDVGAPYRTPVSVPKSEPFIASPGESAPPPRDPISPAYIRKSIRDLTPLYLTDKNGELVPSLNWTPEKIDSLQQSINDAQRPSDYPDYICESLTLTGVQKGETAEMQLKMQFIVPQKPVIRIPLQLNGAILLEAPKNVSGEYLVPQNGGGYVLFLESSETKQAEKEQKNPDNESGLTNEQTSDPASEQVSESSQEEQTDEQSDKKQDVDSKSESDEGSSAPQSLATTGEEPSSGVSHKHEITLKILVPLQKNQSLYTLNMKLPKALFSQISLETPFPSVELRASPHSFISPTESLDDGQRTRIGAYSLGSEFLMQWQPAESEKSNSGILESYTDIHVDIRPGVIFYTANMQLQFANQSPSDFILNLPPSAEALPSSTNEYTIEPLQDSTSQNNVQKAVKIHLNKTYQSSVKLTFQARAPIDQLTSLNWQDLMGFGIRGSVRQNGCIGINIDRGYQVIWNPGQYVSRVDELPEAYEGDYQYAFLFSEQPCSLMARIVSGRRRINVQPQYKVFIGEEEVRLDVSWTYIIRGGQVNWLDVDLNGWQLRSAKDIGPETTFTSEFHEDNGRVSVRLTQPTTGSVTMNMTLYANIEPGAKDISFQMPQPRINSADEEMVLSPGILYVVSATNVKLNPTMDKTEKLVRQNYTSSEMQKVESGELFCYRVDDQNAQFKSSLTVLPQQIEVQTNAQAAISSKSCVVEQSFEFSVLYKPVSQALFIGSGVLAEMADLKFTLDGKELSFRKTADDDGNTKITAILEEPKIGNFVIVARYSLPLNEDDNNDEQSNVKAPLLLYNNPDAQDDDKIVACKSFLLGVERNCELISVTSEELEVREMAIDNEQLTIEKPNVNNPKQEGEQTSVSTPLFFTPNSQIALHSWSLSPLNSQHLSRNPLLIITVKQRTGMVWDSLTVDRAWIQTWLTPTRRQDAVSFQFVANRSSITLVLPPDVDMGSLEALLDSHSTDQFRPEQGQRLVINIPNDGQTHILETSYNFTRPSHGFNKQKIQLPYIEESKWTRWMYWSLCVPKNIHLLTPPAELNAEYSWQSQGTFFSRNSVIDFGALEKWSGSRHLPDLPQGTNAYLFSGFGQVKDVEVLLVDRSVLVAISSLIVLVVGLIILHIKPLQRIGSLSLLAIVIFFAWFWKPDLALLLAQASALGCALLALSFMLRKKSPVITNSDTTIAQISSTRSPAN